MSKATEKTSLRWSVEKRLEFIDSRLYWDGQINRSDIMSQFAVSVPQASKDISLYQEHAPQNIEYDTRSKKYLATPEFKPVFCNPDPETYLWQMRDDIAAAFAPQGSDALPPHDIVPTPHRNILSSLLREVLTCLRLNQPIEILYQSMSSSEPTWRTVSPHAFAFDGFRWHMRAYCHRSGIYKDFLLARLRETRRADCPYVAGDDDAVWHEVFTVTLKPHPKLTKEQSSIIAQDYGMEDNRLHIPVRLALLYYFLRHLRLESCDGEASPPNEQQIVLANKAETRKAIARAAGKQNEHEAERIMERRDT